MEEIRRSGFDLLTVDEVAVVARCSRVTVYRCINDGSLEAIEVAGSARIHREALRKWLSKKYRKDSE